MPRFAIPVLFLGLYACGDDPTAEVAGLSASGKVCALLPPLP
jgi:hypothetical protein